MSRFPVVPLGDVARPVERPLVVTPGTTYRTIGVKWWGEGAYERATIDGSDTAAKTLYLVREGDLIINKIWVRHGSTAIATKVVDGCAASNEFPVFELDASRVLPRWMHWLTKTAAFWDECAALSRGTSGKNRIKPGLFLTINVPLPSIDEQQRIVARIDELAAKIEEARGLRHEVTKQLDSLAVAMAHRNDLDEVAKRQQGWTQVALQDVVTLVQEKHAVNPEAVYPNLGIYSFGRGLFPKPPIQGMTTSATSLNRVHAGQFIYSRLFAFEGAYGFVDDEYDGSFVSNEYPTFDCDHDCVRAEFLYAYFKSPSVWREVAVGSKGLGHRRQRVQPEQVLAYGLWLPPLAWQEQIRQIFRKLDNVRLCQAEIAAELDAFLPSVLDKALRGKL